MWEAREQDVPMMTKTSFLGIIQPVLWVTLAAISVDDEIEFGYVKHDDVWHYKHQVQELLDTLNRFKNPNRRNPPFSFPFEWETKEDLLI